ncbi:MAG TPA: 50S ribosomal protein L11 methyltransferase [Verrucomicrobiae bacterium]|jgi:ribosomal protein L11 methyltransferase|nr:50S ribosomal protein L11 methyltransferase [Verrucomicrobiae bacterium]
MNTRGPIWKVSVTTTTEAEEAVTELLYSFFELPVSSYTDVETGQVTVATYLTWERRRPAGKLQVGARNLAGGTPVLPGLREGLKQIAACGLNLGPGKLSIQKIRREDWAESWKRHFKPIEIGHSLLIKPSWSKRPARKNQAVIVLDPGLSFGTGQHPTTSFCLGELVKRRFEFPVSSSELKKPASKKNSKPETQDSKFSFLDIGSGSGILAIAAAKLGYAPVDAFDFDPEAVRIARENARKNRVLRKVHITRGDVTKLALRCHKQYDLICANLISTLLLAERPRILARLKRDGILVVAGILNNEFALVQQAYECAGLRLIASRVEKEWRSGAFTHRRQKS